MNDAIDRDNPWPGLASYDEAAQAYFAGRDAESAELVRRIVDEPVTVLFGKSGLGKSSLLKAGVFPELRQRGLLPVPVRLLFGSDAADPVEQLANALFAAFAAERIDHPPRAADEPLWDYLHRDGLRFWTSKVRPVQPVFVLDQFEEVFTLGRRAGGGVADALRDRLADLAENRIPAVLAERAERGEALALDVHARPYKIVLSLREDFLPDLEGWMQAMPALRRNRMRLTPLQRREALQAVHNSRTEHLVDAALAGRIVDYLAGAADGDAAPVVEPALLSLVCRGINEARKRDGKACFDDAMFESGKGRIVADFYRESMADQPARVARFIEDELVTEQGFRNSYSVLAAVERGLVRRDEIAALVDRRLLRLEHHLGAERVELTHDLLTRAVLDGRSRRRLREAAQQRHRQLLRLGLASFATIAVVGAIAVMQYRQRVQAETAEQLARSRELASASRSELSRDAQLAVALAAEGLRTAESSEARSALLNALRGTWPSADLDKAAIGGSGRALAVDPAGLRLAVVSDAGQLSLWSIEPRNPRKLWQQAIELADGRGPPGLVFAADGASLYVSDMGGVQRFKVAGSGERETIALPVEQAGRTARQLAMSRDGHWLAAILPGRRLLLRRLDTPGADWESVEGAEFDLVAVSADGRRLVGVRQRPLRAVQLERTTDGGWTSTAVDAADSCRQPQSISPAPDYVVSTWLAVACTASLTGRSLPSTSSGGRSISDSIASGLGGAYTAIMSNRDLLVGVGVPDGGGIARTLRGVGGEPPGNMSGLFAVDEQATRVALLNPNGAEVRVFHVGGDRLLLTESENQVSATTGDGRWLAQAPRVHAESAAAELRIHALGDAFGDVELPRLQHRLALPARVRTIHATRSRLLVTLGTRSDAPRQVLVVDAASGAFTGTPLEGEVNELGGAAELLVVPAGTDGQGRPLATIVRRSDDQTLAPWAAEAAALVDVSDSGRAVLVRYPGEAGTQRADTYVVRGGELQHVGQLLGLPDREEGGFGLSDDGRQVRQARFVSRPAADPSRPPRRVRQTLYWSLDAGKIVDTRVVDGTADPPKAAAEGDAAREVVARSPNGTFEIVGRGDRPQILVRVGSAEPEFEFPQHARAPTFSGDERLLAYAVDGETERDAALHVVNLQTYRPWLELPRLIADRVSFSAGDRLLAAGSQFIPLDTPLLLRFARWHVQTPLAEVACKRHRLEGTHWCARPAAAPAAASRPAR